MALSLAISAASTASSLSAQKKQAAAQTQQQQQLVEANNTVAEQQQAALRQKQAQEEEASTRENQKARQASQKARSSAEVAAGEAGVSGNSVDAMLQEYDSNLGQFLEATRRQDQFKAQSTTEQIEASKQGNSYQNLQINAPVTGPNYGAAAVKFGGEALGAYNLATSRKKT